MLPIEKLLRHLISIPSVNPGFLPANHPHGGEERIADFLATTATQANLDVEFKNVFSRRANVLVHLLPSKKIKKRIWLAPHMDTVGLAHDHQLHPVTKHGRVYGRGACDTKGSIAAMLTAVMQISRSKNRPRHTEIVFAALVDEENGQAGSRALVASGAKGDLAIVGEPTRLQVVTAHKGDLWLQFETRGKSAHGSRPELGRNAVHSMSRIVDLLETTYAAQLRRRSHPVLGQPTISVGSIHGGTQPNIVPAHCVISADRRTIPGESESSVRTEIRSLLRKHGLRATLLNTKSAPCLPLETDPRLPLVKSFLRLAGQRKPLGVNYFCDASILSAGGIPSVVFGPGDIAQAHTADEWISLRSLDQASALLVRFIESLP